MSNSLKKLQPLAWVFSIIHSMTTIKWAVLISMASSFIAAIWAWVTLWGYLSVTLASLIAFAAVFWIFNGIIWLKSQNRPLKERMNFDYAYGLALEGLYLGRDEQNGIQLGLILYNATAIPMVFQVEDIDVIVGDRAIGNPLFTNKGGIIPSGTRTTFYYPPFNKTTLDALGSRAEGIVKYSIVYGHPDAEFSRRAKKRLKVSLRLDERPEIISLIEEESDKQF